MKKQLYKVSGQSLKWTFPFLFLSSQAFAQTKVKGTILDEKGTGMPGVTISITGNAGHDDENAMTNPDANWGYLLQLGANAIQTDRPFELLAYLRAKGLHD